MRFRSIDSQSIASMRIHLLAFKFLVLALFAGIVMCDSQRASAQSTLTPSTSGGAPSQQPGMMTRFVQTLNPVNWKLPGGGFRLPSFMVPRQDQDRIIERKDGLMSDVRGTASRSWTRTKEVFNPVHLNPMNMLAGPKDPAQSPAAPKSESPGFFRSLFAPPAAEPEERVAGVNDFLGLKRPQ
ncbi:MAG: hypothetical protein AAGD07_11710 [Planctomycetota bacterium]